MWEIHLNLYLIFVQSQNSPDLTFSILLKTIVFPHFEELNYNITVCFQKYDQSSLLNDLIALTAPKCGKNLKTAETNHFPNFWVSDLENCNVFFSFLKFHVIKSRRSSHIWKPSKNYQKLKPLKLQWKLHTIPNFRALNSSQFFEFYRG